jgi:hypothetical protein
MSVIKTKRNFVCAYEPLPEDQYVETWLIGSEERHLLLTQPIDCYQEAVDWAVGMADKMALYIDVVPITDAEHLHPHREEGERAVARMTDRERGELRQVVVSTAAEVMRDCPDRAVRAKGYDVLVKMRVVRR